MPDDSKFAYLIPNWEDFQHYKKRNPPWVRLYFEFMSSEDWLLWNDASRVLAIACILLASRYGGKIPANTDYIKKVCHLNKAPDFQPLLDSGFIVTLADCKHDASKPLAKCLPESESDNSDNSEEQKQNLVVDRVIYHLSQVTGRNFKPTTKEYRKQIIRAIRDEKATEAQLRGVIDLKWSQWGHKPEMAHLVAPPTLFGIRHWGIYAAELEAGPATKGGRELRLYDVEQTDDPDMTEAEREASLAALEQIREVGK